MKAWHIMENFDSNKKMTMEQVMDALRCLEGYIDDVEECLCESNDRIDALEKKNQELEEKVDRCLGKGIEEQRVFDLESEIDDVKNDMNNMAGWEDLKEVNQRLDMLEKTPHSTSSKTP